jgi:PAS domain S-box-containing protein
LDIAETLSLYRETIVDRWVRRVHKEISPFYSARPLEELFATVSETADAYFSALVNHDFTTIDGVVRKIGRMRADQSFPLSDVQKAFDVYRSVVTPILLKELDYPVTIQVLENLNLCLSRTVCSFSDFYQALPENRKRETGNNGNIGSSSVSYRNGEMEKDPEVRDGQSEERYRIAIERSNDGVSLVRDGRHIYVNQKFMDIFGYSRPEDIIGKSIERTLHPDDRGMVVKFHGDRQRGSYAPSRYEFKGIRQDGAAIYLEASVSETAYLGEPTTLAYLRDITDRKKSELQLDQERETFFSVLQNAPYGIFLHGSKGATLFVNPQATAITGYTMADIPTGTDWFTLAYPDEAYRNEILEKWHRSVKENTFDGTFNACCKDGETRELEFRSFRLPDGKTVSMFQDNTLRRQAEEDRARLEAELRQSQKMEAVGQLAGGIAHDFNNILTVLIGFSNLLQMKMKEDDPLRRYVDQIRVTSERAVNLTQSLLVFSRKQTIELKPQKINTLISGVQDLLLRLLREDVELVVRLPEKSVSVLADTTQIEQVLLNLTTNAQDAMPEGGKLRIEVKETEVNRKTANALGLRKPGRYGVISLTDTGIGMDGKTKEKIFEPFFTTKAAGRGTGLGLSIVYGIVKQHNGYITVSSKPAKGSTFYIYLPVVETQAEEGQQGLRQIAAGNETVLVAEDDREVRYLTREILKQAGYGVIEAVDGEDAVRKFAENREAIALIILDVVMPKKNGKQVYEEIAEIRPDIKALFVSGYTGDVVLEKGVPGRTADFISKPVAPDELLLRVRNVLDRVPYGAETV